jgi:Universal stress protein UspA and related nucleotide-binding proteins
MTTNLFERILVPTDLSDFGDLALRYALSFNERLGSKLTLLYAEEISWLAHEHPIGYYFENVSEAKQKLTQSLHTYATSHVPASALGGTLFVDDAPESAIVRTASDIKADLIILGTHGYHGIRRAVLGSVAEHVLRETDIPVITVNPSLFPANAKAGIQTVLCPVNFTPVARAALEQASAIAESFQAQLVVMHVCEGSEPRLFSDLQNEFGVWVDPQVRANTRYKEMVVHGHAAARVLEVADEIGADLLVIGAQHKFFRDSTVIGTTTERITRFAKHAVMTVIRKPVEARVAAVA